VFKLWVITYRSRLHDRGHSILLFKRISKT
jgi:hypothetical protein